ncbi:M23 family metallopeptidase [Treponema zuelzerae]|uniref:M23 family metallopeptidase n=1 Tax=Teretinema zuelzerae TaxID=156 RepID=A0AAE3JIR5_9SPIR|nr:M23 family metallopeptidase [Teretinema zuelzerae]MCD1653455.1 M23 family metallopeptidase [Teretinema zuelzerae]
MDVITVYQPDNALAGTRIRRASSASRPIAFQNDLSIESEQRIMPVLRSFPVFFLFLAFFSVSSVPLIQNRYGHHRLADISLPSESSGESALRLFAIPDLAMGSMASQAAPALPSSFTAVSYQNYKVRNGDTVSGIMGRFGLRNIGTILSVNGIDNARRIRSGQTLRIPSMDGILHTVSRGESLHSIASRHSLGITAILDANDLETEVLVPNQKLFIPGGSLSTMDLRRAMGELFVYPITGRLTSPYGSRKDPFTGARTFHTGIDLAAPTGTRVKTTLDGKVAVTGYSPVYGNYVIVTHDSGYQSLYAHLSSIAVKRGQSLTQGAILGRVGNTGYSTGSHLHFSVYRNGKTIDPHSVLK